jgi:hypothetical protein
MTIRLALEIPAASLRIWQPFTDLDFVLAHKVLEDRAYAEFFRLRSLDRELILDNSMHELGVSLPILDLLEACERVNATHVIAPDKLEDPAWTLEQFNALAERNLGLNTAVVLAGDTPEEREHFLEQTTTASLLCLPFRRSRLEWFFEQHLWTRRRRFHLLGMSSFHEVDAWAWIADQFPRLNLSIDTGKPFKAGLLGRIMDDGFSLRGMPVSSADLLNVESIDQARAHLIQVNIQALRQHLGQY